MSNPCLIDKNGTIANPKIPRYEKLKYNLLTNGPSIKTGRMIDGKEEYVKRFGGKLIKYQDGNNYRSRCEMDFGINVNTINVLEIAGTVIPPGTGNFFGIDNANFGSGQVYCYVNPEQSKIIIVAENQNYVSDTNNNVFIDVYFTYK